MDQLNLKDGLTNRALSCLNLLNINIILALSIATRLLFLWIYPDQNFPDTSGYLDTGRSMIETGFSKSWFHMPLYGVWAYLMGGGIFLKLSDIIISVLSVWLIYSISREVFKNELAAKFSALIAAIYPHFLFYATSRLTETSFTALVLLAFLLLYRSGYLWACVCLVVSIYIRPTFDLFNPILILVFALFVHKLPLIHSLRKLGIYALVYIGLMTPWWVHNYMEYNTFIRLNLAEGHILYSGNNPMNRTGGGVSYGTEDDDLDSRDIGLIDDPVQRDKELKKAAIDYIVSHPKDFIKLMGIKFIRFWRLWPYTDHYNQGYVIATSLLSYGVVLLLSVVFTLLYLKSYFWSTLPMYLFSGYLSLVHMITIGSIRYRFPIEPFLIILAGFVISRLLKNERRFT